MSSVKYEWNTVNLTLMTSCVEYWVPTLALLWYRDVKNSTFLKIFGSASLFVRGWQLIVLGQEGWFEAGYTLDDQSKKQVVWEPPGHPSFLPHFLHFLPPAGTQPPNPGWAGGLLYHMSSSPPDKNFHKLPSTLPIIIDQESVDILITFVWNWILFND